MNKYDTVDELWIGLLNELLSASTTTSRVGDTKELIGWGAELTDPRCCLVFNPLRGLPPWYPAAELIWYLSGSRNVSMISEYAPQYKKFANDGIVHGAYGDRWAQFCGDDLDEKTQEVLNGRVCTTQLTALCQLLHAKPDTRQAIVTCWDSSDLLFSLAGTKNDIPCTLSLQFLLREGKLNLITTMRSNDAWLGTPNDIFCFCCLQILIAQTLRVDVGSYHHRVGSMHLYCRNEEKARVAANPATFDTGPFEFVPSARPLGEATKELVRLEAWNRENKLCYKNAGDSVGGPNSLLGQILYMATSRWSDSADKFISSKLVLKSIERSRNADLPSV